MKQASAKHPFLRSAVLGMACVVPLAAGCSTAVTANTMATPGNKTPVSVQKGLLIEGQAYPCPEFDALARSPGFVEGLLTLDFNTVKAAEAVQNICIDRFYEEKGVTRQDAPQDDPNDAWYNPDTRQKARI